ncbi:MAG TPA: hypothetical protein VIN40_04390 [Candidatus Tyrphobacter sp.]
MTNYTELSDKLQTEFLESLKQVQDLNLKALQAFPTPTEIVEQGFAFTNRLLEARKEYAVALADLATQAQKAFAQSAKRAAETAKN